MPARRRNVSLAPPPPPPRRWSQAAEYSARALSVAVATGDVAGLSNACSILSRARHKLGDDAGAIAVSHEQLAAVGRAGVGADVLMTGECATMPDAV